METKQRRTPFGRRLYEARKRAGLTQEQVAARLKISQGTIGQAEISGQSSTLTIHFARLYNVDPWWLATGEGTMEVSSMPNYSIAAMMLARHFDELPEETNEDRQVKKRVYQGLLAIMMPFAPASTWQTPVLDEAPIRERSKHR